MTSSSVLAIVVIASAIRWDGAEACTIIRAWLGDIVAPSAVARASGSRPPHGRAPTLEAGRGDEDEPADQARAAGRQRERDGAARRAGRRPP
jgi:hypothetical protein